MILIRHGQSEFNVLFAKTRMDPGIRDPKLTDLGRKQITAGAAYIKAHHGDRVKRIITSPYTRTLQSAEILSEILNLPIMIDPNVGEQAYFTCDIGTPCTMLRMQWPTLDFLNLAEEWWPVSEEEHHVDKRAQTFRSRMALDQAWPETIVVSHWGFIRSLTGHKVPNAAVLQLDPTLPHPSGGKVVSLPEL
ncbi:MAG: phosphoglycerate mutase family protein [Alphaproteobacteria bacterium]|nr:phosphoglycerate mutase family protein [Alphaproteobacteria bacterium]